MCRIYAFFTIIFFSPLEGKKKYEEKKKVCLHLRRFRLRTCHFLSWCIYVYEFFMLVWHMSKKSFFLRVISVIYLPKNKLSLSFKLHMKLKLWTIRFSWEISLNRKNFSLFITFWYVCRARMRAEELLFFLQFLFMLFFVRKLFLGSNMECVIEERWKNKVLVHKKHFSRKPATKVFVKTTENKVNYFSPLSNKFFIWIYFSLFASSSRLLTQTDESCLHLKRWLTLTFQWWNFLKFPSPIFCQFLRWFERR